MIEQPPEAVDLYDAFSDEETPDEVVSGTTAPSGGAWSIQGDTDPDWLARGAPFGGIRREGANDSTSSIATGQFLVLGATPTNDYTNITATLTDTKVKHKGTTGTQTILGLAVRFSLNGSQPNCLLLAVRAKRRNDGKYKVFLSLYKLTGSTPTVTKIKDLDQYDGRALDIETLRLAVDTAGTWTVTAGAVPGRATGAGRSSSASRGPTQRSLPPGRWRPGGWRSTAASSPPTPPMPSPRSGGSTVRPRPRSRSSRT